MSCIGRITTANLPGFNALENLVSLGESSRAVCTDNPLQEIHDPAQKTGRLPLQLQATVQMRPEHLGYSFFL